MRGAVDNVDCGWLLRATDDRPYASRFATTRHYRDTSPQGEAFGYSLTFARLPLRGAVDNVDCGWFLRATTDRPYILYRPRKKWCCGRFFGFRRGLLSAPPLYTICFSLQVRSRLFRKIRQIPLQRQVHQIHAMPQTSFLHTFICTSCRKHHCFIIHCTVHCKHSRYFPSVCSRSSLSYSALRLFSPSTTVTSALGA